MPIYPTCSHVKEDGTLCAVAALRGRRYCYYHLKQRGNRLRRAVALSRNEPVQLLLPPLEDLCSVQVALSEVFQALGSGQLEPRTAGKMLYALQQATTVMLRVAQMKQQAQTRPDAAAESPAAAQIEEYPEFERHFDIEPGTDLDAATDRATLGAQQQLAVLSVVPTPQPGLGRPVPAKSPYTREEAYQMMQWEINLLRRQLREFQEERDRKLAKKQAASATAPVNTATNSA